MTRAHVFTPPPHLAAVAHQHTCPTCGTTYACYGASDRHNAAVRPCGSAASVCNPIRKKA